MNFDFTANLWRRDVDEIRWSEVAKSYARCNNLVISKIVGWNAYGFRDLSTGWPGVVALDSFGGASSHRVLMRAMVAYVAKKEKKQP